MRTEAVHFRCAPNLKAALTLAALAEGRTLSNYIERVLQAHVDAKRAADPQ